MILTDGTGSGFQAGVTNTHRLLVDSDSHDAIITAATDGKAFNLSTGLVTLTTASVSGLFYLKNNEIPNLIFSEILFQMNASTGGAGGIGLWEIIRNPTGGTLISTATALSVRQNFNFGSTATLSVDAFKGAEGATITGGDVFSINHGQTVPNVFVTRFVNVILPRGASLATRFTPPAGNTSIAVSFSCSVFLNSPTFASVPA